MPPNGKLSVLNLLTSRKSRFAFLNDNSLHRFNSN